MDVYVKIKDEKWRGRVDTFLMDFLPAYGFGADCCVGFGLFQIELDKDFDPAVFAVKDPTAFLSLSLTAFYGIGKCGLFYRIKMKFGRLVGDFAAAGTHGGVPAIPFKNPILMHEPGALLRTDDQNPPGALNDFSDAPLLPGVHTDPRIRHCGIPLTLPIKTEEMDDYL